MRFVLLSLFLIVFFGCAAPGKSRNSSEFHYTLGVSYLRANDATQALNEFLQAEEIEDDDAPLQAALGQAYYYKKAYEKSEKHYLKALKIDHGNPQYQNNLAALYLELQRWDEAINYFHKAATNLIFAQAEVAWTGYGYAYFMKGDHIKAIEAYIKAIDHNERYPQAFVRRGEAFHALGQPAKAVADYKHALRIFPDYVLAHYNLAVSSMALRNVDMAIDHFKKVIALAPESNLASQSQSYLLVLE